MRSVVRRSLFDFYLTTFLARDDGEVNEKGEGTFRDAYIKLSDLFISFFFQVYDDGKSMFMVMELMRGGELLDRILKHKSLSEREAAVIMHTLASTFTFLHEEGVCVAISIGFLGTKTLGVTAVNKSKSSQSLSQINACHFHYAWENEFE